MTDTSAAVDFDELIAAAAAVASMTGDTEDDNRDIAAILASAWELQIVSLFPITTEEEASMSGLGQRFTVNDEGEEGETVNYAVRPLPLQAESAADLAREMGPLFVPDSLSVTLTVKDTVSPGELALYYSVSSGQWIGHRAIKTGESLTVVWQADELDDIGNENERDLIRLLIGIAMVVINEFGLRRVIKEWKTAAAELIKLSAENIWAYFKANRTLPDPDPDNPFQPLALSFVAEKLIELLGTFTLGKLIETISLGIQPDPDQLKAAYEDFLNVIISGQAEDTEDAEGNEDGPPVDLSPDLEDLLRAFVNSLDEIDGEGDGGQPEAPSE